MQALYNYWFPKTIPSTVTSTSSMDQKDARWLAAVSARLSQTGAIESRYFRYLQNRLAQINVPADHPLLQKIQAIQSKHPLLKSLPQSSESTSTSTCETTDTLPGIQGNKLVGNFPLDVLKNIIKTQGAQFDEIVLNDVDDDLLALIAAVRPTLAGLRIITANRRADNFTDAGLNTLASLKNLTVLEINSWLAWLSPQGLENFLGTPSLQSGLTELTIYNPNLSDKGLAAIASFKALKSLEFESVFITSQGLLTLFQSPNLKTSLEKICIITNSNAGINLSINDGVLASLSTYDKIQDINLGTDWKITEPNFLSFLDSKKNLLKLNLRGTALSPEAAAKIEAMGALTSLSLNDCSKLWVGDFCNLLKNKDNVTLMSLAKAGGLLNQEYETKLALDQLSKLPHLNILYVSGSSMWNDDFDAFCIAPEMQNHLNEFYLTGAITEARSLGNLKNLHSLTVLRIDNCPKFNDDALKAIYESPLKDQLTTLQLNKVSITERSFQWINNSSSLKKLLIADSYAFSEVGRAQFFDLQNLQKNLTVLLLDDFPFPDAIVPKLAAFTSLQLLIIFNNNLLSRDGAEALSKMEDNSQGTLHVEVWYGDDDNVYRLFDGGL